MKKILAFIFIIIVCVGAKVYADNNTISVWNGMIYYIKTDDTLYGTRYEKTYYDDEYELESVLVNHEMAQEKPIKIMENVASVSGNFAIKDDSSLWEFTIENYDTGKVIIRKIMDNVKKVSSTSHTLILTYDNELWGLGDNTKGQLAQGTMPFDKLDEPVTESIISMEYYKCEPAYIGEPIKIMDDVADMLAPWNHSVVLKQSGDLYTFGLDWEGELGQGHRRVFNNVPTKIMENVDRVFAGTRTSFAITKDDNLLWGCGEVGKRLQNSIHAAYSLTMKKLLDNVVGIRDIQNVSNYSVTIKSDDSLWMYGKDFNANIANVGFKQTDVPKKISDNVVQVRILPPDESIEYNCFIAILRNDGVLSVEKFNYDSNNFDNTLLKVNRVKTEDENEEVYYEDIFNLKAQNQKAILSLSKANIISGTSESTFSPEKTMTRAEVAALLLRMTAKDEKEGNGGFYDVGEDKWYYDVAGASKKYSIVNGYDDNTFRGDEEISKLQLIVLCARVLKGERNIVAINNLTDIDVDEWAKEELATALAEQLITEVDLTNLNEPITRGEAAVILYRLYGVV